jgi:hypothetical protein
MPPLAIMLLVSLAGCHWLLPLHGSPADGQAPRDRSDALVDAGPHSPEQRVAERRVTEQRLVDLPGCSGWCQEVAPAGTGNLHSVWVAPDASQAFAVGDGGVVLHRDAAGGWTSVAPTGLGTPTLKSVSGFGGTIWIVGSDPTTPAGHWSNRVWRRDAGNAWTDIGMPSNLAGLELYGLTRVVATQVDEVAAVAVDPSGGNTWFLQFRGGAWVPLGPGSPTYSFVATDLTVAFSGAQHEEYLSGTDGVRWTRSAGAGDLIWKQVPDGNYPTGTTYQTIFSDGSFWCALGTQTSPGPVSPVGYCCAHPFGSPNHTPCTGFPPLVQDLRSLWAHPSAGWFAVGANGVLLTFTVKLPVPTTPNVSQPTPPPAPVTAETLNSVSGGVRDGRPLVIAVGNNGTIVRYTPAPPPPG